MARLDADLPDDSVLSAIVRLSAIVGPDKATPALVDSIGRIIEVLEAADAAP